MHHMTQEVAVIEFDDQLVLNLLRQRLEPFPVIATQGDVKRDNILRLAG